MPDPVGRGRVTVAVEGSFQGPTGHALNHARVPQLEIGREDDAPGNEIGSAREVHLSGQHLLVELERGSSEADARRGGDQVHARR